MYKSEVLEKLKQANVTKVVAEFSGGGDEGGFDDIVGTSADGDKAIDIDSDEWNWLCEYLDDLLDGEYGGFCGSCVRGSLNIDVESGRVWMTSEAEQYVEQADVEF